MDADDLVPTSAEASIWLRQFDHWRRRWACPTPVELRDADRSLRLTLDEPAHLAILRAHLDRTGHTVPTETAEPAELGWIDGHAHQIVVPLVTTQLPAPSPLQVARPVISSR